MTKYFQTQKIKQKSKLREISRDRYQETMESITIIFFTKILNCFQIILLVLIFQEQFIELKINKAIYQQNKLKYVSQNQIRLHTTLKIQNDQNILQFQDISIKRRKEYQANTSVKSKLNSKFQKKFQHSRTYLKFGIDRPQLIRQSLILVQSKIVLSHKK
ncbi:transmembrane protein, putative (macronuclear) [Tetrahymena thermophila SB210]|uniref:Transmembrane protein, putative n=1 Tax=Tetrahymena thermophila (strain SB210) TaxID=312017 RepID=W7X769_TETTS|nr:transmembrane protein, putative [Tetrahymena thermophila SB210]EWS72243.1 transmembrane protein, putative [Tetrahymena thermophila SB210]|eukprot:XP_012655183.1 transmembrane protein, putative [Tetrahymena thermophila SB210]